MKKRGIFSGIILIGFGMYFLLERFSLFSIFSYVANVVVHYRNRFFRSSVHRKRLLRYFIRCCVHRNWRSFSSRFAPFIMAGSYKHGHLYYRARIVATVHKNETSIASYRFTFCFVDHFFIFTSASTSVHIRNV